MIELPEARKIAEQMNSTIRGKRISGVVTAQTPHKLAWYYGKPEEYASLLTGKLAGNAQAWGGLIEIEAKGAPSCSRGPRH